jgi:protein SCO1
MRLLRIAILLCLVTTIHAAGQDQQLSEDSRVSPGRKVSLADREFTIPDLLLLDQDGKRTRLYTDLLKDKTVVLSFFYTDCFYVCTRQGELFSSLQKRLGPVLGKDVFLLSVTMNPQTDTPKKLKSWGRKYGRQSGWTLVTGQASEVETLLRLFTGESVGPREVHAGLVYIGDDRTGRWLFIDDLTPAAEIERKLYELKQ